ncbi:ABC transporter ATP-binding protein [Opitutus sp. GAS368]|jgi:lipoprotein-releasing system ATP-binding protein|uniref:ABC transporter ATP-binding protein n=1 Tax=Opitutus sp. GAS368 TaxID=1882749 RepID=UPI00087A5DD5|nr:ABC transporter ATP-binding protein [Opitutus sp. GAS368]SDR97731.1 lipoprotein-releasing system ATP-binding protein [Opitutus sp. GAS368]
MNPGSEQPPLIVACDLRKTYDAGRVRVLDGVDLEVRAGEMVALWGASGSGKSTLLHLLGGLDVPDAGELTVCGLDPRREDHRLTLRRRHVGFVFQLHNLIPDLTVAENLRVPALASGAAAAATRTRIGELAEAVGIAPRLDHRIQDISGGERQRTAICRALMNSPRLLLADEPTGSLDEETGDTVFNLLRHLVQTRGIAVVLATHERRFAEQCDRVLRVRSGRIETA